MASALPEERTEVKPDLHLNYSVLRTIDRALKLP